VRGLARIGGERAAGYSFRSRVEIGKLDWIIIRAFPNFKGERYAPARTPLRPPSQVGVGKKR